MFAPGFVRLCDMALHSTMALVHSSSDLKLDCAWLAASV